MGNFEHSLQLSQINFVPKLTIQKITNLYFFNRQIRRYKKGGRLLQDDCLQPCTTQIFVRVLSFLFPWHKWLQQSMHAFYLITQSRASATKHVEPALIWILACYKACSRMLFAIPTTAFNLLSLLTNSIQWGKQNGDNLHQLVGRSVRFLSEMNFSMFWVHENVLKYNFSGTTFSIQDAFCYPLERVHWIARIYSHVTRERPWTYASPKKRKSFRFYFQVTLSYCRSSFLMLRVMTYFVEVCVAF